MGTIDEEIQSKFENDHQRAIVNILYTANWLKNLHADALKPYDITSQQFNILRILRGAKDWAAMNDVKCRMVEKSPNTTRLADKLLKLELIERKRSDEDRRVVYVKITKKGLAILKKIDNDDNFHQFEKVFKGISKKEARKLSGILDELRG